MSWITAFAQDYVMAFNEAVASGDFSALLARFSDDAVMRLENVPPAGAVLEFAGLPSYTAAYADRPPDDQIDIIGEPAEAGETAEAGVEPGVVVAFAWRRDRAPGTLRLTVAGGLIRRMVITFG